ncbi:MAG: ThiF family adenylyltransferase [Planctomycetota bacterium]
MDAADPSESDVRRFERQTRFAPLGLAGQRRLESSRVLLVGCGALGGALAQSLVRSGVGELVLADRDVVDVSNLPRQVLFDERHAREGALKVAAAAETLARIGGPTRVTPHAVDVDVETLPDLAAGVDLVLDGTDNMATRYLINDYCVAHGVPWIYAGVVGAHGLVLFVRPGSACLRCVFPTPPPPGALATCETGGVVQPAVAMVAALSAAQALRALAGDTTFEPGLLELDAWNATLRSLRVERDPQCPCCGARVFPFLEAPLVQDAVRLCGRDAVQVRGRAVPLAELARSIAGVARRVQQNELCVRFEVESQRITVFAGGRALVEGTSDLGRARALYRRYVGA